jgi:hypothetical protein
VTPERKIELLERRLLMNNRAWLKAAKEALDGDVRALRLQVDLHEAPPMKIVLSGEEDER